MEKWNSKLAKAVEIDTVKLVDDGGYFEPNPTLTKTESGTVYKWTTGQFESWELLVKGEIGIVDNGDEYFVLILVDGELKSTTIDLGMFEIMKKEMLR